MAVLAEPNTSSEIVLEAQKLLNKAALQSRAPEDGAFDKSTVAALKAFQSESGLSATGVLDEWIALPLGVAGSCMVYRQSHVAAAGFDSIPADTDGFLALCQTLAKNGTPATR